LNAITFNEEESDISDLAHTFKNAFQCLYEETIFSRPYKKPQATQKSMANTQSILCAKMEVADANHSSWVLEFLERNCPEAVENFEGETIVNIRLAGEELLHHCIEFLEMNKQLEMIGSRFQ